MSGILHDPPDHGSVEDEWEEPTPLRALVDLPAFPVEVLPDFLAAWVRDEAIATQTPPDLAGMLVLTALAAAAGGLAEVQLRPGWREPLNLFTATTLPPGNRKSAVFRDVTRPLVNFDRDEAARMQTIVLEAITARKVAERAADAAQATAGKATGDGADAALAEAIAAAARAEAIHVPSIPRLLADDATPEALATLLADHGRISLLSPEGGVFDMMAGRYQSGGPSLDVYLKGHAGDAIRVDRKGRPAEYVEQPALTVGLAVQPEVLRACKDRPGFRGRGLLARFLYSMPTSTVGHRRVGAPPVPDETVETYRMELQALARSLLDEAEAARMVGSGDLLVLTLDTDAAAAVLAFEAEIEPRLHPHHGDLAHIADWASKLVGAVARIAGLLHLAARLRDGWALPVNQATITDAIAIGRYLTDHALATFDLMGGADPTLDDARYLLAWIERTGAKAFTRRELFTALPRGRFAKVDALDPPLALLVEHSYLRLLPPPERSAGPGRPASPGFEVNPLWRR
jgi:replicative DNA helicase